MNAPVLAETPSALAAADWRRTAPPLVAGLLLLGGIFNREVVAAVQTWEASTAYNHCFLVIPIVLYLLWDRRFDLTGIQARPLPWAILLAVPIALTWLAAERLGIMEGRQLAVVSFVEVLFYAVLGKRLWWAVSGPLLYLYFLVPFGEFLTPKLQDVTTYFIRHGLEILRIPAFIDGYIIEIPQGTFFVAEACAGLRFLIASIAFGCLYALTMYRSPVRRGLFILVSITVPVIANGFRGLGIVYLGYLLGSAQAAAADHIIYGWLFFSAVILILIALGLPFRQDEMSTRSACAGTAPDPRPMALPRVFATAIGVALVAAVMPALTSGVASASEDPLQVPARIDLGPSCIEIAAADADPALPAVRRQHVVCGQNRIDVEWEAFSSRVTAGPVIAERRRLVARALSEGLQEFWLDSVDDAPGAWRIMRSNDPAYMTAVAIWVDGKPARPGLAMRARMAVDSLFGADHLPIVMTMTPAVDWDTINPIARKAVETGLTAFLATHQDLTDRVGALSASR